MTSHDLKDRVAQVLAEEIGPALDLDGAAIEVVGVDGGVVQVRLAGACVGCPSTVMTLSWASSRSCGSGSPRSSTSKPCRNRLQ